MNNFIPFPTKVWIKLLNDGKMLSDGTDRKEIGEVVATGSATKFLSVGDLVFFGQWGFNETAEHEGQTYCVVEENSNFIQGKIPKKIEHRKKSVR